MTNPYESPRAEGKALTAQTPHDGAAKPNLVLVIAGSLVAMLPWPLIAIGLCHWLSIFERAGEVPFLFGGVTLLFLIPIMLIAPPPEWLVDTIIVTIWMLVLILPALVVARRRQSWTNVILMFTLQAAFSLLQAGLAFLMMCGKYC
jgi:hypothetical protein